MRKNIAILILILGVAGLAAFVFLNRPKTPTAGTSDNQTSAPSGNENQNAAPLPGENAGDSDNADNKTGQCACPAGYRQEGDVCNPECYYSAAKCLVASFACGQENAAGGNGDGNDNAGAAAGIANPASTYCVQQGGKLEIRENTGGQYGVCIMPDGTECDEWDFFRTKLCLPVNGTAGAGDTGNGNSAVCGRENCHGLDIKCGQNVADVCTMEYQLGDKCLRLVNCGIVNGVCQQISNAAFDACKSCVEKCQADFANDQVKLFDCESKCPAEDK